MPSLNLTRLYAKPCGTLMYQNVSFKQNVPFMALWTAVDHVGGLLGSGSYR